MMSEIVLGVETGATAVTHLSLQPSIVYTLNPKLFGILGEKTSPLPPTASRILRYACGMTRPQGAGGILMSRMAVVLWP